LAKAASGTKKPAAKTTRKASAVKKPAATKKSLTTSAKKTPERVRPWVKSYPEGIKWDSKIDTTPVHEQILASCDRQGSKIALDFLGATTSYRDLGRRIRAFAGALQKHYGIKKGSRVALMMPNTPFYPVAYFGVLLAGGTVVNCNPLYTVPELSHILENAGAELLITLDLKVIYEKADTLCSDNLVDKMIVCHFPDALPLVKRTLFNLVKRGDLSDWASGQNASRITPFDELINQNITPKPVTIDPGKDVAVQQYTGGTTGIPKGAMLSHANIAANLSQIDFWGCGLFDPPSKTIAILPFFHIFAMTVCMNIPLAKGGGVVMLPRFDLKSALDMFARTGANVLPAIPTLSHALATSKNTDPKKLASLDVVISGGAALPNETRTAFAKVSDALLAEGYGLTECSPVVCCSALNLPGKPMSIGLPLPGTDIRFADIDHPNREVKQGERGELQVKGPQVMLGYYENKEATRDAFVDGWFRTGDVGYMDEEGYTFLVDRIKDLIICSGYNVYPRNIEEALYKHPAVDECNVIGVEDSYRGEAPVAFVKLNAGQSVTASELKSFLAEHISKIEIPRDIIFKDELPKTLVGKLSKKELRDEYAQMKEKNSEPV